MSRKLRESFVGHPDAILFCRISREGVFQQPPHFTNNQGFERNRLFFKGKGKNQRAGQAALTFCSIINSGRVERSTG
jgi:hypothetical protein